MSRTNARNRRRRRRGSILILVVALLVLLTLIGTAYLSSTRTERYTANQSTISAEAQLQIDALRAAVNAELVASQYGPSPSGLAANTTIDPVQTAAVAGPPQLRYPGSQSYAYVGPNGQPMPPGYAVPQVSQYTPYVATASEPLLADRVPVAAGATPIWTAISWHPFPDAAGNYVFENPFEAPLNLGPLANKASIVCQPTVKTIDNLLIPGMIVRVVPPPTALSSLPQPTGLVAGILYPGNLTAGPTPQITAASADGSGIAESLLFKMPGGPVDGITYYAAVRVIDNNSAVNASSAWAAQAVGTAPPAGSDLVGGNEQLTPSQTAAAGGNPVNYGFFRSDVDLRGLLNPQTGTFNPYGISPPPAVSSDWEMYALNQYRFSGVLPTPLSAPTPPTPYRPFVGASNGTTGEPIDDLGGTVARIRQDFSWYSSAEALDVLLTSRPGNPGYSSITDPAVPGTLAYQYPLSHAARMHWLGWDASTALAYRFTLLNPSQPPSILELCLPNDLLFNTTTTGATTVTTAVRTTPYGPGDTARWYNDQFQYNATYTTTTAGGPIGGSLRPLLTGNNAVTENAPSRFTNPTGLPGAPWQANVSYRFGDWVTGADGRAYVCTVPHLSSPDPTVIGSNCPVPYTYYTEQASPPVGGFDPDKYRAPNPTAVGAWAGVRPADPTANANNLYYDPASPVSPAVQGYYAARPGLSFVNAPTRVSINTAPFDELWLGFCQVMTDSVGVPPGTIPAPTTAVAPVAPNVPQWLPPMRSAVVQLTPDLGASPPPPVFAALLTGIEPQMPMFQSVIRDMYTPVVPPVPIIGPSMHGDGTALTGSTGADTVLPNGYTATTGTDRLSPAQMLKLRGALAAVNAEAIRGASRDVPSRMVILSNAAGQPQYEAEVFGLKPQPFIGGVYAHVDPVGGNYVAIQLLNPYDVPIQVNQIGGPTPASAWRLGIVNRTSPMPAAKPTMVPPQPRGLTMTDCLSGTPLPAFTIPARTKDGPGRIVLTSGNSRPPALGDPSASPSVGVIAPPVVVPGLEKAIGQELYLLKPRRANGQQSARAQFTSGTTAAAYDEYYTEPTGAGVAGIADLVPVDQIDMSSLTIADDYVYRRGSDQKPQADGRPDPNPANNASAWGFVYPGTGHDGNVNNGPFRSVPAGTSVDLVDYYIGRSSGGPVNPDDSLTATIDRVYQIVLGNTYTGGPNRLLLNPTPVSGDPDSNKLVPTNVSGSARFPYGGFARNGDLMQVPFIGSYRIRYYLPTNALGGAGDTFVEMNSVTADASLARDTTASPKLPGLNFADNPPPNAAVVDPASPPFTEQIGRFCPIGDPTPEQTVDAGTLVDILGNPDHRKQRQLDFAAAEPGGTSPYWHYHWAGRLFDYFTVRGAADDQFPNVDPAQADPTTGATMAYPSPGMTTVSPPIIAPSSDQYKLVPHPVANADPSVANAVRNGTAEDGSGTEGLININTAPLPVLATLPFTRSKSDNYTIAAGIVNYRARNGPFQSLFDLMKVPEISGGRAGGTVGLTSQLIGGYTANPVPATYHYPLNIGTTPADPAWQQRLGIFSPGGILNYDAADATTAATPTPGIGPAAVYDYVPFDYQKRFVILNRVSNLITTRSDTFTCYLLVQGWRGVGTSSPTLVVERRVAFFADRNGLTYANNRPVNHPIPTN